MFVSQKIVLKLFGLKYISGLFLAPSLQKSVSQHFVDLLTTTSICKALDKQLQHFQNIVECNMLNLFGHKSNNVDSTFFFDIWCEQQC